MADFEIGGDLLLATLHPKSTLATTKSWGESMGKFSHLFDFNKYTAVVSPTAKL